MSESEPHASRSVSELVDAADQITQIMQRFRLAGQHLVVLGGGRGIGRHTAHALAQMGASVTVVDAERERANEVADEIGISQSYISRLEKRIIRRLRRELEALV